MIHICSTYKNNFSDDLKHDINLKLIFTSFSPHIKENEFFFQSNFWNWVLNGISHFKFLSFLSGNNIFSCWSVCVWYQHNLKLNKSRKIKFSILLQSVVAYEIFYKNWSIDLCTGLRKRIQIRRNQYTELALEHFNIFRLP